jgi:hypothetical protein
MVVAQSCADKAIAASVSAVGNAQLTRQYVARVGAKASKQIVLASAR